MTMPRTPTSKFSLVFTIIFLLPLLFLTLSVNASSESPALIELVATENADNVERALKEYSREKIHAITYGRGYTIAHAAVSNDGHQDVLATVLEAGANVNAQDDDGRTPLHHAIDNNHVTSIKILLRYDARLDIPNNAGFTPIEFCREVLSTLPEHEACTIVSNYKKSGE